MMKERYPALSLHKIPWAVDYTNALVNSLMRIAESKPFLDEYLGSPLEVRLLRKAKVRAITYSNQIEGNALGEEEVTAVLAGKRVAGRPKDVKETKNYHAALAYVEELAEDDRPISIRDMCDIQRLVTEGLVEEKQCGRIRTIQVRIANAATGKTIEQCPEPHALKDLLDELWQWLEDTKDLNPFVRAFAFHFIAVSIHPFVDGNGRTVRLMQHLLLLRARERIARFVPSETAIMHHRDQYYAVLRQSRGIGRLSPVVEFLAGCFDEAAKQVVEEGCRMLRESAGKTPEARHRRILACAKKQDSFSMQDVIEWLPDVPRRTLERDLSILVRSRTLKASGERKARTYTIARRQR